MSRTGVKRKRPGVGGEDGTLTDPDLGVLNVIKSKNNIGIMEKDIKREIELPDSIIKKSLKSLMSKKLIKEVPNINKNGRKHYMAAEIEPSKEITGGSWYSGGKIDKEAIEELKVICLRCILKLKQDATVDSVCELMEKGNIIKNKSITKEEVGEIMNSLVLGNEIIEYKNKGILCYKIACNEVEKIGAMASIPCGMCPRIRQCTPDGIISPKTFVYYNQWLDF